MKINIFWFRRDLRLDDNRALNEALKSPYPFLPLFIFDDEITDELSNDDPRITFIYKQLLAINKTLRTTGSSLLIKKGAPAKVWETLLQEYQINNVYCSADYEPYAIKRDDHISGLLKGKDAQLFLLKDQVIFEKNEVTKGDGNPYTVFTPYRKKWLELFKVNPEFGKYDNNSINIDGFLSCNFPFPTLKELGFSESKIVVPDYNLSVIKDYDKHRDIPSEDLTSHLSAHLRFGTVSIRKIVSLAGETNQIFLSELIWREFFMQILWHFPNVVSQSFRVQYDKVQWKNNEEEFQKWCNGTTGYAIVDAGMRQLNRTGFMHNRVRMITASFLTKHLLIDWRWGEAYFASKLLDFELSSNNGNWQWAAGTGCDAAPYFRVFNPDLQQKRFDPDMKYIKQWVEDFGTPSYPVKIVEHTFARNRAIETYRRALNPGFNLS